MTEENSAPSAVAEERSPEQPAAADDALVDRYGPARRGLSSTAQKWSIIGAFAVAGAAAVWFTVNLAFGELEYQDVGYNIESETRAYVDYEVTKDFEDTAQCMLHVLDDSYAIVGAEIVTLGPHEGETVDDRSQYFRTELRTEYEGVSGVVDSCWLLDE